MPLSQNNLKIKVQRGSVSHPLWCLPAKSFLRRLWSHFFEISLDFSSHWGTLLEPIVKAKWCNEPPHLEKKASLVPEGVPRGPQSSPGPTPPPEKSPQRRIWN